MQGREGWEVVAQGACSTPCLPACLPACLLACTNPCLPACLPASLPAGVLNCFALLLVCSLPPRLLAVEHLISAFTSSSAQQRRNLCNAALVVRRLPLPALFQRHCLLACLGCRPLAGRRLAAAVQLVPPLSDCPCPVLLPCPGHPCLPACLQTLVPSASPSPTVMPNTSPSMPWSNISPAAQVGAHACLLHPTSSRSCSRSRSSLDCRHSCGTL